MDRSLTAPGQFDYDYVNDILFFKVKERNYSYSMELENLVIDFDEENYVVGIQFFNASTIFGISKNYLKDLKHFQFTATIKNNILRFVLDFKIISRNRVIQHRPIIFQPVGNNIPNSQLTCTV
ncbi:MAG TPA: DUF2283 domain-containing protein [Candidatus Nanoarchaeia archaeon]|nr:DUF2283 domain-containing protein [Candidatus Nanoarchaeia archaeon]